MTDLSGARLYAIRGTRYYDLTDGLAYLAGIDGMGLPGVNRINEHGPLQHGVSDIGFRLTPRNLTLALVIPEHCLYYTRQIRQAFLEAFKPSDAPIGLRFEFPDGSNRQLDTHYTGGLSLPSEGIGRTGGQHTIRDAAQLYAPDPTWYDPDEHTLYFDFGAATFTELAFPITFPIVFGDSIVSSYASVFYAGTWLAYPKIFFTGPLTNPSIENLTTGELLRLEYIIAANEQVTIDTRYGHKTVTNNYGTNLIDKLSSDSDLATFHLAADPESLDGYNLFYVSAGDALGIASNVFIRYFDRYIGA